MLRTAHRWLEKYVRKTVNKKFVRKEVKKFTYEIHESCF